MNMLMTMQMLHIVAFLLMVTQFRSMSSLQLKTILLLILVSRHLYYGGEDYYDHDEGTFYELRLQHEEALEYLEGKEISAADDLFNGEDVVEEYAEVDGFTAATMRSNKIVSAIRDALNRGPYSY